MESIFDKAAGLTNTGLGANISSEDKSFIAMYNAGRGLIDCINFYVKRYENDKDCFACFIAGKLYSIKKDYINALNYFEKFCNSVDKNTISIFRHIDTREVTLDWETLKGIKVEILGIIINIYQNEMGVDKDINKIIYYYEQSGILGNTDAFVELGKIYKSGSDIDKDYNKSFMYYKKAVDLGKDDIAKDLIDTFLEGYGIEVDIDTLISYAKNAKIDTNKIYKKFGDFYKDGKEVGQNIEKAIEYYEKGGYYKNIADIYNEGKYIKKDNVKAFQYYIKADYGKEITRRKELIQLGNNECFGRFTFDRKINIDKFVSYYREAGIQDIDICYVMWDRIKSYFSTVIERESYEMGFWHKETREGYIHHIIDKVTTNEIEQFIKYSKEFGIADSMIYEKLGDCFLLAKNYGFRDDYYDTSNIRAIMMIAQYYYNKAGIDEEFLAYYKTGDGGRYVAEEAFSLYKQDIENGKSDAYVKMGHILSCSYTHYWKRKNTTYTRVYKDRYNKAMEYYQKAADMDNPDACYELYRIYKYGVYYDDEGYRYSHCRVVDKDSAKLKAYYDKALNLYCKNGDKGDGNTYYKIGELYEYGGDKNKANEYYKKACMSNNLKSFELLWEMGKYGSLSHYSFLEH